MSRSRQLALGVCGLGTAWETAYRPAVERLGSRARVAAVAGSSWRVTSESAKTLSAKHAGSVRRLMQQECDGVLLTEPDWQAWFPLRAAIAAQQSTFAALPPAEDETSLAELYTQAQRTGVLIVPELRLRYMPATLRLRELLATELGPVHSVEIRALAHGIAARPRVVSELADWCRVVLGTTPHAVACNDVAAAQGGTLRQIAQMFPPTAGRTEPVTATISLPAASVGSGTETRPADAWPLEFSVACKYGEARLEDAAQIRWREGGREQVESLSADRTAVSVAVDHFARRLAGGLIPVPDLGDLLVATRIAATAERSRAAGGLAMAGPGRTPGAE